MKISLSEQTARKLLAAIPEDTTDQDLVQLRQRTEQGLKSVTGAGHLNPDELEALTWAAAEIVETVQRNPNPSTRVVFHAKQLLTAIPKLEALQARRRFEAAGGGA